MKIEKLISVFERLLPIYKEAYEKEKIYYPLISGLCLTCLNKLGENIWIEFAATMSKDVGYYKNLINDEGLLFNEPKKWQDLKPRIDFMEREIKSLKRLIKKGYTHL